MSLGVVLLGPLVFLDRPRSNQSAAPMPPRDGASAEQPNIVFILIDALRADHLPMYGYSRQTAPHLAAFARRGMTLTHMYAPSSWTSPSVASIFSSLYPATHKVKRIRDFLPDAVVTLAEVLREAGYTTAGVSANSYLSPTFGYSQGFDAFHVDEIKSSFQLTMLGRVVTDVLRPRTPLLGERTEATLQVGSVTHSSLREIPRNVTPTLGSILRKTVEPLVGERTETWLPAERITDLTLRRVAQYGQGPCFLYVHYIDPHKPYSPPPPFNEAFDYRSDPPLRAGGIDPGQLLPAGRDREAVGRVLDQYDGEILYADQQIGRLLEGLQEFGILDNALVIITADHGEEFYEHGRHGHGKTLYEEQLHVPFLLSWPGRLPAGATYEGMVGLVDVLPTLLGLLGIAPPPGIQGVNVAESLVQQTVPDPERRLFAQLYTLRETQEMVRHGRYKFIRHVGGCQQGHEEFYDLKQDPLERTNLAR